MSSKANPHPKKRKKGTAGQQSSSPNIQPHGEKGTTGQRSSSPEIQPHGEKGTTGQQSSSPKIPPHCHNIMVCSSEIAGCAPEGAVRTQVQTYHHRLAMHLADHNPDKPAGERSEDFSRTPRDPTNPQAQPRPTKPQAKTPLQSLLNAMIGWKLGVVFLIFSVTLWWGGRVCV